MKTNFIFVSSLLLSSLLGAEHYTIQLETSPKPTIKAASELQKNKIKFTKSFRAEDEMYIYSYGTFQTREEAKRNLASVQKVVPTAFIKMVQDAEPIVIATAPAVEQVIKPIVATTTQEPIIATPVASEPEIVAPVVIEKIAQVNEPTKVEAAKIIENKPEPLITTPIAPKPEIVTPVIIEPISEPIKVAKVEEPIIAAPVASGSSVVAPVAIEKVAQIDEPKKTEILKIVEEKPKSVVIAPEVIEPITKPISKPANNEKVDTSKTKLASVPYLETEDPCVYRYNCGVSIKDVINPSSTKCKFITIKYNCTDPV